METVDLTLTIAQLRVIQELASRDWATTTRLCREQETDPDTLDGLLSSAG